MIDRGRLAQALGRRALADWIVFEHDQELHVREAGRARGESRRRWRVVAHVDTPKGRGTARISLDGDGGDADDVAERAMSIALASVGAAWESPPAAAPARVELADPAFGDLAVAADRLVREVSTPRGVQVITTPRLLRERVDVLTRQGFHVEWQATAVRVELVVIAEARSLTIVREARTLDALGLDAAVADATTDLQLLARAGVSMPGQCSVVLAADAMVPDGLGVWSVFASQADAAFARAGLARFHEGTPIAPGADQVPDPLTIMSDGALAFGVRSAPIGDDGDAVRSFPIVERGVAAGLGLSPREAALRKRDPNGGVRNLVVQLGEWDGRVDLSGRLVEVRRLRQLAIDPYTAHASLEIALGIEHGKGPFTGGTLRLDLVDALAHARRSSTRIRRGPYDGPAAVLIEHAELI